MSLIIHKTKEGERCFLSWSQEKKRVKVFCEEKGEGVFGEETLAFPQKLGVDMLNILDILNIDSNLGKSHTFKSELIYYS